MRISNDAREPTNGLAELLRLQSEFQTVLATETMRYLSRVQATVSGAAGGTVVRPQPGAQLLAEGAPGQTVDLSVEIENRQAVHATATPVLTVLAAASGTTWFPEVLASPPSALIAPGEVVTVALTVRLPEELSAGTYRGALVLHGFRDDGIPVEVAVAAVASPDATQAPVSADGANSGANEDA